MSNFSIDIEEQRVWIGREIYVLCVRGVDKPVPAPYTMLPIKKDVIPLLDSFSCEVFAFTVLETSFNKEGYNIKVIRHSGCERDSNVLNLNAEDYKISWFFDRDNALRKLHMLAKDCVLPVESISNVINTHMSKYLKDLGIDKNSISDRISKFIKQHPGCVSDGYHTFNELYYHRAALFAALVALKPELAWKSKYHHDGTFYDGMFIVGMHLPTGDITYHYDINPWWNMFYCKELDNAPEFDGHTPNVVIARLLEYAKLLSVEK